MLRTTKQTTFVYVLLLLLLLDFSCSQLYDGKYEGDDCELQNGEKGKCIRLSQCESAIELIQLRQHPVTCSFIRFTPIVCCPFIKPRVSEQKCLEYHTLLNNSLELKFQSQSTEISTQSSEIEDNKKLNRPDISLDIQSQLNISSLNISDEEPVTVFIKFNYTEDTSKKVQDPLNVSIAFSKNSDPKEDFNFTSLIIHNEPRSILNSTEEDNKIVINESTGQIIKDDTNSDNFKDDFSHIAALGYPNGSKILWQCTGILVSNKFVLTAGHCLNLPDLGVPEHLSLAYLPKLIPILKTIPHPSYKPPSLFHNIALIKFSYPFEFTISVRPACLYSYEDVPQVPLSIELNQVSGNIEELLNVAVDIISIKECEKTYQEIRSIKDTNAFICGKYKNNENCNNTNYGGPLQIKLESENSIPEYNIIGITSNIVTCIENVPLPIIYISVSHYIPWLESVIWPNQ